MAKIYRYEVEGGVAFPLDMLRYDAAWPRDVDAVVNIESTGRRKVQLNSITEPTIGRWQSFGWNVIGKVESVKL